MSNSAKRIFFDILLFLSIVFMPWWLTLIFGIALVFVFASFYEILIVGLLLDSLYGFANSKLFLGLPLTLALAFIFLFSFFIKKHFVLD